MIPVAHFRVSSELPRRSTIAKEKIRTITLMIALMIKGNRSGADFAGSWSSTRGRRCSSRVPPSAAKRTPRRRRTPRAWRKRRFAHPFQPHFRSPASDVVQDLGTMMTSVSASLMVSTGKLTGPNQRSPYIQSPRRPRRRDRSRVRPCGGGRSPRSRSNENRGGHGINRVWSNSASSIARWRDRLRSRSPRRPDGLGYLSQEIPSS